MLSIASSISPTTNDVAVGLIAQIDYFKKSNGHEVRPPAPPPLPPFPSLPDV